MINNGNINTNNRLVHLDSLRGLACLSVALLHSITAAGILLPVGVNFLLGRSAVIFFFLLSGFVLSRSLLKLSKIDAANVSMYCIRRFFRLYPAIIVALIFSYIASRFLYAHPEGWWPTSEDFKLNFIDINSLPPLREILNRLLLLDISFDGTLWTLRIELVCSFLLPIIVLIATQFPSLLIPLLFVFSFLLYFTTNISKHFFIYGLFGFFLPFYLGYIISMNMHVLNRIGRFHTWLMFSFLVVLLIFVVHNQDSISDSIVLAGFLSLLIPCNTSGLKKLLLSRPLIFMGRISYSFYLLHLPVLVVTYSIIINKFTRLLYLDKYWISPVLLFLLSSSVAIILAAFSEKYVEMPFNAIGHRLSKVGESTK